MIYTYVVLAGFGWSGFLLVSSLLADILDMDELETGAQRAGAFLGFWPSR